MTAVASPTIVQPLARWNSGNGAEGGLDAMSAEEVSRMFMPRKSAQRQNSSSSTTASSPASTSLGVAPPAQTNGDTPFTTPIAITNGDPGWTQRKKPTRGLWPSSKSEPVSALTAARPQALATPSSGQSAASTMNNAMQQQSSVLPSQNRTQPLSQQNGGRLENQIVQEGSAAVLALLPMTGTFERKQMLVPFRPEPPLKIGRQTNAKTVPTAVNGYFDSKVLSRQHAEVIADRNGKIWIKDIKSSNGTFVNGIRLSQENRESEEHELREGDTLELGIDIVSEDQKSIVHHKVSSKVEVARIYSNEPSLLDMMQVDANTGQPLMGEPMGQQLSLLRGRGGSQGSMATRPSSMAGGHAHMMGHQRQMNIWMGPITVEQIVKKLTTELKQAKHQSQDLHQTGDFLGSLLSHEAGEQRGDEPLSSPSKSVAQGPQTNDAPIRAQIDPASPFSRPPAPPPQQPPPEKPDIPPFIPSDFASQPHLTRTKTETGSSALSLPTRMEPQSGQIMSLIEALKTAKQEIDSQGNRMKHLEIALMRERKARETAEQRARNLLGGQSFLNSQGVMGAADERAFEPPLDSLELMDHDLSNGHIEEQQDRDDLLKSSASMETLKDPENLRRETEDVDTSTSRLQARLDLMVQEMNEMKTTMESYKRRAEDAEEGRRSLADMIEDIRAGRERSSVVTTNGDTSTLIGSASGSSSSKDLSTQQHDPNCGLWTSQRHKNIPNGKVANSELHRELEKTFSNVPQHQRTEVHRSGSLVQSAPYVSIFGVVLIGMGIMTWLNSLQPGAAEG